MLRYVPDVLGIAAVAAGTGIVLFGTRASKTPFAEAADTRLLSQNARLCDVLVPFKDLAQPALFRRLILECEGFMAILNERGPGAGFLANRQIATIQGTAAEMLHLARCSAVDNVLTAAIFCDEDFGEITAILDGLLHNYLMS